MRQLIYAPRALSDLRGIAEYIGKDNPARAISYIAELRAKGDQAAERPFSFRARDELSVGLRSLVHGRYTLFFRVVDDVVRIERILHSAQSLNIANFD